MLHQNVSLLFQLIKSSNIHFCFLFYCVRNRNAHISLIKFASNFNFEIKSLFLLPFDLHFTMFLYHLFSWFRSQSDLSAFKVHPNNNNSSIWLVLYFIITVILGIHLRSNPLPLVSFEAELQKKKCYWWSARGTDSRTCCAICKREVDITILTPLHNVI